MGKILRFSNMYKASAAAELCSLSWEAICIICEGEEGSCSPELPHDLYNQQTYKRHTDEGKNLLGNSEDGLPCPLLFEKSKNKSKKGWRENKRRELSAHCGFWLFSFHTRESGIGFKCWPDQGKWQWRTRTHRRVASCRVSGSKGLGTGLNKSAQLDPNYSLQVLPQYKYLIRSMVARRSLLICS